MVKGQSLQGVWRSCSDFGGGGQEGRERAEGLTFWDPGAQRVMSQCPFREISRLTYTAVAVVYFLSDGEPVDFMNRRHNPREGSRGCMLGRTEGR